MCSGSGCFSTSYSKFDIGNDILSLVKGITPSGNDKLIAAEITNKIIQLKTNTERNSYLSIGMFGLCQLHLSGRLSEADLAKLVGQLITESAKIVPKIESPTAVNSSETTTNEPKDKDERISL